MGMDIYGIKPIKLIADSVEPIRPSDEANDKEWSIYLKAQDKYREEVEPGQYFRANVWAWRPIHAMCVVVNSAWDLKLNMHNWENNSGAGLDTQEECTKLADGIEDEMKIFEAQGIGKVYLDGGMYCKIKGVDSTALGIGDSEFVTKEEEVGKYKEAIQYLKSQGVYATKPYLIEDSKDEYVLIEPAYSVYLSHIRDFVRFLRNCGGFEIW